jgi:hypothetical protein
VQNKINQSAEKLCGKAASNAEQFIKAMEFEHES